VQVLTSSGLPGCLSIVLLAGVENNKVSEQDIQSERLTKDEGSVIMAVFLSVYHI